MCAFFYSSRRDPALRILVGFRLEFLWDEAKVTVRKSSRALDDGAADFGRCFLLATPSTPEVLLKRLSTRRLRRDPVAVLGRFRMELRKGEVIHCASLP